MQILNKTNSLPVRGFWMQIINNIVYRVGIDNNRRPLVYTDVISSHWTAIVSWCHP